jgi:hypothetical protein
VKFGIFRGIKNIFNPKKIKDNETKICILFDVC